MPSETLYVVKGLKMGIAKGIVKAIAEGLQRALQRDCNWIKVRVDGIKFGLERGLGRDCKGIGAVLKQHCDWDRRIGIVIALGLEMAVFSFL